MGHCNHPSHLRNRFHPKLIHLALGVPGVTDPVAIELEEFDGRDGLILESRIDRQGGTEVSPLPIQPLLSSACSYVFLCSVDIT